MIIIDLLFFFVALFFVLPLVFGAWVWFKVRTRMQNPFQSNAAGRSRRQDDPDIIEGQYEVVDEKKEH